MIKGIIIYQSKYGATRKYAEWIQAMTNFHCMETSKAQVGEVAQYETILLCGGVYASGIAGLSFLKKNIDKLKKNKLAILCVGASPYDESAFAEIKAHNLTGESKRYSAFLWAGRMERKQNEIHGQNLVQNAAKIDSEKRSAHIRAVDESSYVRGRTKLRLDR